MKRFAIAFALKAGLLIAATALLAACCCTYHKRDASSESLQLEERP